jgi:periplasmic protein TonB
MMASCLPFSRQCSVDALRAALPGALLSALLTAAAPSAQAQFTVIPAVPLNAPPAASQAADEHSYRQDAARHLYARYPQQVHKGKLPPMMYAVMITDTTIAADGQVEKVQVVRPPAAASEVTPWVVELIRRAGPFPAPQAMGKPAVYREIWLVDKTGRFQVDTLTEGQP